MQRPTLRATLEITEAQLEQLREASVEALSGGNALTRNEMYEIFARSGTAPTGQRGYHLLWFLAQTGTLCCGPLRGKQQTFVLVDEWILTSRKLERDEALGEFVTRYFQSHGPATIRDFAWWSSLTLTAARIGLTEAGSSLDSFERDGATYYFSPQLALEYNPDGLRTLSGFDEFLLGYQDRRPQLAPQQVSRILPGKNGVFLPTIVRDGTVIGTWKRTMSSRGVALSASPFAASSARFARDFERSGHQYANFLGRQLTAVSP